MGCCFSARNRRPEADRGSSIDGAPPTSPPGVFEEEAVKEVLMETPIVLKNDGGMLPGKVEVESTAVIRGNSGQLKKDKEEIASEVSEICSYSESLSNATAQGKKDDEEEDDGVVNQRPPPRKRRVHGGGRGRGERVVPRRMAPSPPPEKRGQVALLRPVRGRPVAAQPRNVAEENGGKRDAGEDPVKRSRSPVKFAESDARLNAEDEKIPVPATTNDVVSAEEAETLENPVVSLECFIFL